MARGNLFGPGFDASSGEAWIRLIQKELGADRPYESLLVEVESGIMMDPCYTRESISDLSWEVRDVSSGWLIADELSNEFPAENASEKNGSDAVSLEQTEVTVLRSANGNSQIPTEKFARQETQLFAWVDNALLDSVTQNLDSLPNRVSLLFDPFSSHANSGVSAASLIDAVCNWIVDRSDQVDIPHVGCLSSTDVTRRGASYSTRLCYLASAFSVWCQHAQHAGLSPERVASQLTVEMKIGTRFYEEVASIRALKLLLLEILRVFTGTDGDAESTIPHIHVRTSEPALRDKDHHRALINSTTAAVSAALGQPDSILVSPPLLPSEQGGRFESRRLVQNILLMLRHESLLDAVRDPLAGSYYVERLTNALAETAWQKFLEIEQHGGLASDSGAALMSGWILQDQSEGGQSG